MFNVFIDSVLQHVWEHHPGVPIPPSAAAKLVALMYADDLVGTAANATDLQSLINHTRTALNRWRLKASVSTTDASKTAVMVVEQSSRRGAPAGTAHTFTWGDTTVPIVNTYKYLGVYVTNDGKWEQHLQRRMDAATASARMQRKVLKNVCLPAKLRRDTLTSVVQPTLTYAAEVWARPTSTLRRRLDSWQMGLAGESFHCPPTASHACLQQELGIALLHVTCETLAMKYWHHLQTLTHDRLLHQIAVAWSGRANPWKQNIDKLLAQYNISPAAAATMSARDFNSHCALQTAAYLQAHWQQPPQHVPSAVHIRYINSFGVGQVHSTRPAMRKYIVCATETMGSKGRAVELCMHMRMECLPLHAMHAHARRNESPAAQQARQECPCCRSAAETPTHFVLECPAYASVRAELMRTLQASHPNAEASISTDWRALVGPTYLDDDRTRAAVLDYVVAAWTKRRAALTGREANGGDLTAYAPEPRPDVA
jgi:hypothetical protein